MIEAFIRFRFDTLQRPVLHLDVSTPQKLELHLDLYGEHADSCDAPIDVSTYRDLSCTWICLHLRVLSFYCRFKIFLNKPYRFLDFVRRQTNCICFAPILRSFFLIFDLSYVFLKY
jgi:hypothetical protein